jgi:glycosyltransferase involved in cell wall biosynthesis
MKKHQKQDELKIAQVTTIDWTLKLFLKNFMKNLIDENNQVVAISSFGPHVSNLEDAGIRHISVKLSRRAITPLADIRALWNLYKIFKTEKFTIVHTHTPKAGIIGRAAAKFARIPVIVHTNHGFIFSDRSHWLWRTLFVTLERVSAKTCDFIFSVNQEDIETAINEKICPPEKIHLLGQGGVGIDVQKFDPNRISPEVKKQKQFEIGIPEGNIVVGFVGRLVKEKGILEFFSIAQILQQRFDEISFVIVGPIDYEKPDTVHPHVSKEYGIFDKCHFLGLRDDMPELYSLMDVIILPSHREGFPVVLMEASAMGIPIVTTDVRGCREAVENGLNGFVVPLGDIKALSNAVIELLENHDMRKKMSHDGHLYAKRFDEQRIFLQVSEEYKRLLKIKRGFYS